MTPSQEIANFQSILSGDFDAIPQKEAKATGNLAIQQRDELLAQCKNKPGTDGDTVLTFTTSIGQKIQFSSGKSPLDTVKMLDEAYLRLAHGPGRAKRNDGIAETLLNANDKIPFEFRKMAVEVREEATAIFGKESVNQSEIGFLVREPDLTRFASQMTNAGVDLSPDNLRDHFRKACLTKSANNFLLATMRNAMAEAGIVGVDDKAVNNAMKALHPELAEKLAAATSADEAKKLVDGLKAEIVSIATKCGFCNKAHAKLNDFIQEAFAKEMGVEWKHGDKELVNLSKPADSKGRALSSDILTGKVAASDKAGIDAEFKALAAKLAHGRAEQLRQVDGLGLPTDAAFLAKVHLLYNNDPHNLKVDRAFNLSKEVDVKGLADAFKTNASKEKIYQELVTVSQDAGGKLRQLFEGAKDIGGEENMLGIPVMMFMALGKEPELATQLAKFFARPDVQADLPEAGRKMPQNVASLYGYVNAGRLTPADLAATLGKPSMDPLVS